MLTDDFPKDHFHHRGLFWAWPHVEIDGKQYESWVPATLEIAFEFIHPSHPDFPPTWLTRHYGCLCVGWPGVAGGKLEPGVPVRCAYRVWIHSGESTVADLERAWREYAAEAARPAPGPEAPPGSDDVSGGGPSRG